MLYLYKDYFISFTTGVIKNLTSQYISLFFIIEKVGYLAYKLAIPKD